MSVDSSTVDKKFLANSMASFLQIGALVVLIVFCYRIVSPFVTVVVWGLIISIAIYPTHKKLTGKFGGREKISATVLALIGIAVITVPVWFLAESTIGGLKYVATELHDGQARIPPPDDSVAEWPIIGERVHRVWASAASNLEQTLNQFQPQMQSAAQSALGLAGHAVGTVMQFIFSVIIASALLPSATGGFAAAKNFSSSLVGTERGEFFTCLSIDTVRSVVKGVLGVAIVQSILAAIGLMAIGVPGAGLWAGAVLVLAIVQLPPLIILGPIAFWVFSVTETVPATIFLIYAFIVSISDTFLKPLFLGRGIEVPMLVILIGAIGGAISMGILGLFLGAVILALGYELLTAWMAPDEVQAEIDPG
jgi:predicted PurR-regulated permease PerM